MDAATTSVSARRLSPAVPVLGAIVATSAVVRAIVAWHHSIPRLFPDEYIYTAIGRSLGDGHLAIRGGSVRFPAVFEPVVAAPLWRFFSPELAYHLIQVENAIVASLAAVPVYLLARRVGLARNWAITIAAYALLTPELVLIAYISSDSVGYTLALSALAAGVFALDRPTRRAQSAFLVLSTFAALTRVEYVALAPAYLAAALIIERRTILRHWLALAALVPAVLVALAGAFGYYLADGSGGTGLGAGYGSWLLIQPYLTALVLGVAIVPGAIAGLLAARSRAEKGFAFLFSSLFVLILIESTKVAAATHEFKERYLFLLFALAPVSFGLYVKHGRPFRNVAIAIAVVLIVVLARLPISGYAESQFKTDSQSLFAISRAEGHWSIATVSTIVALVATAGALIAIGLAFRGPASFAMVIAFAVALAATFAATTTDLSTTQAVRKQLPKDLRWVDHSANGPVTAIETPTALQRDLLYEMFFNEKIKSEVVLDGAFPSDAFKAPELRIDANGRLDGVHGDVLFHDFGTLGRFANARSIVSHDHFTLWRPEGRLRLRYVIAGRYWDGWLTPRGRLEAWPTRPGARVSLSFRLSLPRGWPAPSTVTVGQTRVRIRPGESVMVTCNAAGHLDETFRAQQTFIRNTDLRTISVRLAEVAIADGGTSSGSGSAGCQ